jgi:carbon storage regulator
MLVLTRKCGQSLVIGNEIVVTLVRVRKGCVRVAIDAPRDVPVHREEVHRALEAERQPAGVNCSDGRTD